MLIESARIIRENVAFYLTIALLMVAAEAMSVSGLPLAFSHLVVTFGYVYVCANLPFAILKRAPLADGVRSWGTGRLAAGLKVVVIILVLAALEMGVLMKVLRNNVPGTLPPASILLELFGILLFVQPIVIILLGSWIPAGIMRQNPGFMLAIVRGVKSIRMIYPRLLVAYFAFAFVFFICLLAYASTYGVLPSTITPDGKINVSGVAFWCLGMLWALAFLTYVQAVICLDYVDFEKSTLAHRPKPQVTA